MLYFYLQYLIQKPMSRKARKWSTQVIKTLKNLKEEENCNQNGLNWEKISKLLNQKYDGNWSAKQCRQKYINDARLFGNNLVNQEWSREELEYLLALYEEHGASWSYFSTLLKNRSQCSIKNKFNNNLKRTVKLLQKHEKKIFKKNKRNISNQKVNSLLIFVNKMNKFIKELGFTPNKECQFFRFRTQILNMCILNCEEPQQDNTKLIENIRQLSSRCKSFGAFKQNNRSWKLTYQGLLSICQFDQVTEQILSKDTDKPEILTKGCLKQQFPYVIDNSDVKCEFSCFTPVSNKDQDIFMKAPNNFQSEYGSILVKQLNSSFSDEL